MKTKLWCMVALVASICIFYADIAAPSSYDGKAIRIIVGHQAGGGYDAYARLIARHMGKYIPGHPSILVENMVGAGALISANYLYKVAKPDGLTIGHFNGGHFMSQVLRKPGIEFDARKFEYIGAAGRDEAVFALSKGSRIRNFQEWKASDRRVKLGGTGTGAHTPDNVIRIVASTLGLPIQLIAGYKGVPDIRLACEAGELEGSCWSWNIMRKDWRAKLETGDAIVVLQAVPKGFADLATVPLAIDYATTQEARVLIELGIHNNN